MIVATLFTFMTNFAARTAPARFSGSGAGPSSVGTACSFDQNGIGNFLGFPTWYKYLPGQVIKSGTDPNHPIYACNPQLNSLNDIWLIVAAIIEMLLRVASLVALGFVIWGGVQYLMSQGEPDRTAKARHTIINALVGLVITVLSTAIVNFLAGSVK